MRHPRMIRVGALALAAAVAAAPLSAQKEAPPPVGTPKALRIPKGRDFTLPNGLRVTFVPFGTTPKAAIRLQMRFGKANETFGQVGRLALASAWVSEGTQARDGAALAADFAAMGGGFGVNVGDDETSASTEVLTDRAADAVALLAEAILRPRFAATDFERVRSNALRNNAVARSRAQTVALEQFAKATLGEHPVAQVVADDQYLKGVTPDEVAAFWRSQLGARRSRLYVVGRFDAAAVEKAIRAAFGGWEAGPAPALNPAVAKSGRTLDLLDRPKAVQSTLLIGVPVADPSSPDATALDVTNELLGGAFGSRITSNIREQKGYTYSPFGAIDEGYKRAVWYEQADVTTNVTGASLKEIFYEVERLRREPPSAEELTGIQQNMIGVFTLRNGSRQGIIGQLAYADLHGLGAGYAEGFAKRVLAVTPQVVQRTAQKYLDPAKMKIVVVGDKATVEEQVAPYRGVTP